MNSYLANSLQKKNFRCRNRPWKDCANRFAYFLGGGEEIQSKFFFFDVKFSTLKIDTNLIILFFFLDLSGNFGTTLAIESYLSILKF